MSQEQTDALVATVTEQITLDRFDPSDHPVLGRLVEGLGDTRGTVRLSVAELLGEIGEPTVPFLLAALADHDNVVVRRAAAKTLTLIADPSTVSSLIYALNHDEDTVVKGSSVGALARIGEPAVQALLDILASEQSPESMKGHAAWALAFIGTQAKGRVFRELKSESASVRAAVIGVIAKVVQEDSDDQAAALLIQSLADVDVNVRSEAAAALGNSVYRPAVPALVETLNHQDWQTRKSAALALMKIGDRVALDPLQVALEQESEDSIKPVLKLAISQLERQFDEDDWD